MEVVMKVVAVVVDGPQVVMVMVMGDSYLLIRQSYLLWGLAGRQPRIPQHRTSQVNNK